MNFEMVGMGDNEPTAVRDGQNVESQRTSSSRSSSREASPRQSSPQHRVRSCSRSSSKRRSLSPEDPRASGSITLVAPPCSGSKTAITKTSNVPVYKRRRINRKHNLAKDNSFTRGSTYYSSNAPRFNSRGNREAVQGTNFRSQHVSHREFEARCRSQSLVKGSGISDCKVDPWDRREVQRLGITRYTVEAFRDIAPSHINGMLLHQVEELRSGERLCCRCGQRGHLGDQCADWKTQQCPSELRGSHRGRCQFTATCQFTHHGEEIRRYAKQVCTKVCLSHSDAAGTTIALVLGCMSTNHGIESCPYTICLQRAKNRPSDASRRSSYSPTRVSRDKQVQQYRPAQKRRTNSFRHVDRDRFEPKKAKASDAHSMAASSDMLSFLASSDGVYAPQSPVYAPSSPSFVAATGVSTLSDLIVPIAALDKTLCARDLHAVISAEDDLI